MTWKKTRLSGQKPLGDPEEDKRAAKTSLTIEQLNEKKQKM
jgi:hypothetical protein